ncbi:segregation/condensation protein A [archaeon]|jgi:segregation and condensation protein A|nr:segregation/condensation protein A [archaeon]MBT3451144.1 segregation/condensation protein A [archaeon]MBT6869548.1 segregation/condensation protein A [archaeon]MBT7193713.1 segregation/condensation protein A [archaeon]MBT7380404.1 segregation/condensation protein A [archaeon]
MQEKIFDLLLENDDITWKSLLYDLVKTEQMNPWNINLSLLAQRFIVVIKEMKEHDLKISGKMLLAAAILLKMKSSHLIDHDIAQLDLLISETEDEMDEDEGFSEDEDIDFELLHKKKQKYKLIPRNPQPRSRKVSIHDLVDALQRAMSTKKKVLQKYDPVKFNMPDRDIDIMDVIRELYNKIVYYSKKQSEEKKKPELTFSKMLPPRAGKIEKVYTFIPMLHLENQKKIKTRQDQQFEEIYIKLNNLKKKEKIQQIEEYEEPKKVRKKKSGSEKNKDKKNKPNSGEKSTKRSKK